MKENKQNAKISIKKAERWRIDAFELWCWRRLFTVPWIAKRSNQSILKEISLEYSLAGLMLKLKLQYFGHLMQRTNSLENTLMLQRLKARGEGDDRGWDVWMASPTQWTWVWVNSGNWWWTGRPGMLRSMGSQSQTQLVTQLNLTEDFYRRKVWVQNYGAAITRWMREAAYLHKNKRKSEKQCYASG